MERQIFLVRHLATEDNLEGRIMGAVMDSSIISNDTQISKFRHDLSHLVEKYHLHEDGIIQVFSSPLKRCLETTKIITETLGKNVKVYIDKNLQETNMGDYSEKKAIDLRNEYGNKAIDQWMYDPEKFVFPGGESYKDVKRRSREFLDRIRSEVWSGNFVFVCSHVDIIKMIICEVKDVSFNTRRSFSVPNGSISVIGFSKDGSLYVKSINAYP